MTALLKDALQPNLVQTLENSPAFIHGGPFANIAHGCNSVIATKTALKLADYVVTEAGFGADLGAEKFIDIKCRKSGLRPDAVVIVATIRALKYHGGVDLKELNKENLPALEKGIANLERHVNNVRNHYGLPCVVSINHFTFDTDAEIELLKRKMAHQNAPVILARHWAEGGKGAEDVARAVVKMIDTTPTNFKFVYDEKATLWEKITTIAQKIYGAAEVTADSKVRGQIKRLQDDGYGSYPVCVAKTQYSFSTDPLLRGAPSGPRDQHPRGAPRRGRGVHRHGLRRHHDHARAAEGAVGQRDRRRRRRQDRRVVLAERPRGPRCSVRRRQALRAGLTLPVDGNGGSGRGSHLHPMLLAAEVIGDIPIVRAALAGCAGATLDVLGMHLLAAAVATDVGADRGPRDRATGRGDVLAAPATDLVTENAADDGARDGRRDVGAAAILHDLLALDPAALLGRSDHGAHRRDIGLVQPLIVAPMVVVDRDRGRRVTLVIDARAGAHDPHR